jgi:predicted lipoprotein with Yx(FWY)xxD motif
MKFRGTKKLSSTAGLGLSLVAVAAFAAACNTDSSSGGSAASSAPSSSASSPAASSGSGSTASTVSEVDAKSGSVGTFLTDSNGKSLYLWVADKGGKSTCSGDCATAWPPATVNSTPKAGMGVTAGKLSTITRDDGSKQLAYNGHPLYYYAGDQAAGDTNGQGSDAFGAKWWLVAPSGDQITKAASTGSSSTGSSSTGSSGSDAGGGWS